MRGFWVLALSLLALPAPAAPLLWQYQGPHVTHYLMGSIHALPPGSAEYFKPYEAAYTNAQIVVFEALGEIGIAKIDYVNTLHNIAETNPGGLRAVVGDERYAHFDKLAHQVGLKATQFDHLKAWFASSMLSAFYMQRTGFDSWRGVDQSFYYRTFADSKERVGLEDSAAHNAVLEGMDEATSKQFFDAAVDTDPEKGLREIAAVWRSGDLGALEQQVREEQQRYPLMQYRLLEQRNRAWIKPLTELLKGDRPALIIVGAAHYCGKTGLPALLAAQGIQLHRAGVEPATR